MHASRTLYVVADGGRARLAERTEAGAFKTRWAVESPDIHSAGRDLVSDAPGRSFESAGATRHAIEPRVDPRDKAEDAFVRSVARRLNGDADVLAAAHLVIAAPARVLGALREGLSRDVTSKIRHAIPKDLTKVPDHALSPHLPVVPRRGPVAVA